MPIFKTAPTVQAFTEEWTARFGKALKEAAGKDGRVSLTEAKRLAEKTSSDGLFSDTAVKVLDSFGQKTMSVNKLIDVARLEVENAARLAAGADGRISLDDAKKLPADLRDDFNWFRTATGEPKQYTDAELRAVLRSEVQKYLDSGNAQKLSYVPSAVKGRKQLAELHHPASNTRADIWVANNVIYISRASPVPSPLVGWYKVGPLPAP